MLSRAARVPQCLPPCRPPLSQHLVRRLASTEAADATPKPQIKGPPLRTAYIRTWRPIQNITESWIIVREVEKRYGKILETHFLKDFEDSGKYQMMTWVVFEDPKSMESITESGTEVSIPSRPIDKPNHEISLEDAERLVPSGPLTSSISPELEEVPAADPENDSSVLGFRIYPAKGNYKPESVPNYIYQRTSPRVLEQFHAWGGFANLAPLDPPRIMRVQELFAGPGANEQKRMRAALDHCKRSRQRYYPHITLSPPSSIKSDPMENKTSQELSQEPSSATPKSARVSNTPASASTSAPAAAAAPTQVVQEPASTPSSQKAKSEPPKSAPQPTKATTSKAAETTASKTPAAKATTEKESSPSTKASKPTGQRLPPPVVQQRPTATIPRRLPKPKLPPSRSSPLRSSSAQHKATTEDDNGSEGPVPAEPVPAEPPSTLSKLWGLLIGRRG